MPRLLASLQLGYMEKPWIRIEQWLKPHASQATGRVTWEKNLEI